MHRDITFSIEELENELFLSTADQLLVVKAREATAFAYAPYSGFKVAAAARLTDGTLITGTNQENASYPVGICAERTLLSAISALHLQIAIDTIAVTYYNEAGNSSNPVAPCGICRQTLVEYELRNGHPIRIILTGFTGKIILLEKASYLLPLGFSAEDMK